VPAFAVGAALVVALGVLALTTGDARTWGYRAVVVIVGFVAIRALVAWHAARPPPPDAFRRRRPWPRRRRSSPVPATATDRAIQLATVGAGDAHRGLRPLLRDVADERLRARHGIGIDDPRAAEHLAPPTWDLLRPDRPPPHDVRAPGVSARAIDDLLTDLEEL
jgi:hypothetical protein